MSVDQCMLSKIIAAQICLQHFYVIGTFCTRGFALPRFLCLWMTEVSSSLLSAKTKWQSLL